MKPGTVNWMDLTVDQAETVRDFYSQVTGWDTSPVSMAGGEYEDYCMLPTGMETPVAGVCHRRGVNSELPPQWLIYINVEDLDESMDKCIEMGGKVICDSRQMGAHGRMCVIEDPAGAVAALFEPRSA